MSPVIDLTEQRFGRLTVISRAPGRSDPVKWVCICSCGKKKTVGGGRLRSGLTKSCGCLTAEVSKKRYTTHGESSHNGTPEYRAWRSMLQRCCNSKHPRYAYYGGRGVTVCDRWRHSYQNFLLDMGRKPSPQHSLDKDKIKTGNLVYCPEFCSWATKAEQAQNTRTAISLTFKGETKNLSAWAKEKNIKRATLEARLKAGWSLDRALGTLPDKYHNRGSYAQD